jgi:hypothetical protein
VRGDAHSGSLRAKSLRVAPVHPNTPRRRMLPTALLIGPEKQAHFEHRLTVYGPDLLKRLSLDPLAGRKARGWPVTKKGPARPFRLLCC